MSVGPDTKDEQLKNELEVGVEESLRHADLDREEAPLLLVIEHVDQEMMTSCSGKVTTESIARGMKKNTTILFLL